MRDIFLGDICFICSIVEDDGTDLIGIVNPLLKLVLGDRRTGGIIGIAQIDKIGSLRRKLGSKSVLFKAGHVDNI